MKHGLTDAEFFFLQSKLIQPLKEKKAKIFLFGSRATGHYQKFSDIDILYIPDADTPLYKHFIFSLLSEIEESNFPYKIDLVNIHELALSYKEKIEQEKIEL